MFPNKVYIGFDCELLLCQRILYQFKLWSVVLTEDTVSVCSWPCLMLGVTWPYLVTRDLKRTMSGTVLYLENCAWHYTVPSELCLALYLSGTSIFHRASQFLKAAHSRDQKSSIGHSLHTSPWHSSICQRQSSSQPMAQLNWPQTASTPVICLKWPQKVPTPAQFNIIKATCIPHTSTCQSLTSHRHPSHQPFA